MATCFIVSIAALIGTVLNLALGLVNSTFVTSGLFIISGIYYLLARYHQLGKRLQYFILITALTFTNLSWWYNYGSQGPVFTLFLILFAFFIFVWDKKYIVLITSVFFINLVVLFALEYNDPTIVGHYNSEIIRVSDYYTGNMLALVLMLIFSVSIKTNYLKQFHQARHADKMKTAFLANMSHEIRTPLNAIVGFSSLVTSMEHNEPQLEEFKKIIDTNSQYLLYLIEDMIDLAKLEVNNLHLNICKFDLKKLLEQMKYNFEGFKEAFDNDIELDFDLQLPDSIVVTDPLRVEQVLRNLIANALKFTKQGSITLGCSQDKDKILFYIKDTGIGIREENKERIFERFTKIEENPDKLTRGTGIGLFLSKQLVELLGGEIWVNSSYKKGSTFYFTIKNHKRQASLNFNLFQQAETKKTIN